MKRDVFQAISDPTRRKIIILLSTDEMTPSELAQHFKSSRQAVSVHIQILLECGLLNSLSCGRSIIYSLKKKKLNKVKEFISLITGKN